MAETQDLNYHPQYSAQDAALVLLSSDNVRFRVHPAIIRMASRIFNEMLEYAIDTGEPVVMQEKAVILKAILDNIYPNAPYFNLEQQNFQIIWELLISAEKFVVPGILEEFRARLMSDTYFVRHPLQAYVIACHYGWRREAMNKSAKAIDHLRDSDCFDILKYSDFESISELQKLAAMRKEVVLKAVEDLIDQWYQPEIQNYDSPDDFEGSGYEMLLETFSALVYVEMDKRPSGEMLRTHFWNNAVVKSLLSNDRIAEMKDAITDSLKKVPYKVDMEPYDCDTRELCNGYL